MRWYKADLHVHTVLSPCGGLDMSPVNIVRQALLKELDIIAITDHNSTRHCRITQEIGKKMGLTVLSGAEINTREEIHCLTFFENIDKAEIFQQFIDANLMVIENKPDVYGHQFIVDEDENIIEEEHRLLVASLRVGIDEVAEHVAKLKGLFIPAHINRMYNGIYSQIGFLPSSARFDALEVSPVNDYRTFLNEHPETERFCLINNSDAHNLERIGAVTTGYYLEEPGFEELMLALRGENGRKVKTL